MSITILPSKTVVANSPRVFLGGTCNNSQWRDHLIPMLNIDYFNPVVDDWTLECYQEELIQRETCDYVLYVLTPKMSGVYSVAEVVDDSNKRPEKTVFCWISKDGAFSFDTGQRKSMTAVANMVVQNGATYLPDLKAVADWLNGETK